MTVGTADFLQPVAQHKLQVKGNVSEVFIFLV